jgi:hypothetical protein
MNTKAVAQEILAGGDLRLSGAAGAFLFRRLKPGVLLTAFEGRDTGEFGTQALEVVAQEHRLFGKPVEWFFDATHVDTTAKAVSDEWTKWLRANRRVLAKMHVLTGDEETHLRISVARHFSDSQNEMALYTDRAKWGIASSADLTTRFSDPALDIAIVRSRTEGLTLTGPRARWTFRSLENSVVTSTFAGDDDGSLTWFALAEMQRLAGASRGKVSWFLDLREARNVAAHVSETWTAWLTEHSDRFARVSALAESPLFPLVLTVAKYRSGTERLFHIHRDPEPFEAELAAATSGG